MPKGRAGTRSGERGDIPRASSSFNHEEVAAFISLLERLDEHHARGELVLPSHGWALRGVRRKFLAMRESIERARALAERREQAANGGVP